MTTEYSISVDWSEESEDWEFVGADLMRQKAMEHIENCPKADKETEYSRACDIGQCKEHDIYPNDVEDNNRPMMNYAYPIRGEPTDEEIIEVCERTNCTVVKRESDDEYFLALTGGGMDLSQSIALAYIIIQGWIPSSLAREVCTQPELSVSGKDWLTVAEGIKKELKTDISSAKQRLKEWNESIKEFKANKKSKVKE